MHNTATTIETAIREAGNLALAIVLGYALGVGASTVRQIRGEA